jgi:hypothetical protein
VLFYLPLLLDFAAKDPRTYDVLTAIGHFIYDFQTLITGLAAIGVAIFAGVPVWRQLRDTNLQTRISHRETLAGLLREALQRNARVKKSIEGLLLDLYRTSNDGGDEPIPIKAEAAHHFEQSLYGKLDWYLIVEAGTEHDEIEACKRDLGEALRILKNTLADAYLADVHDQDDGHDGQPIPDDEWNAICQRCDAAKLEVAQKVTVARRAYSALCTAQDKWVQSLRIRIGSLDIAIGLQR